MQNDSEDLALQKSNTADVEKGSSLSAGPGSIHNDSDSPAPADPNIVTWDGPEDPANPMNWSKKKKVLNVATVSMVTFLTYEPFPCVLAGIIYDLTSRIGHSHLLCSLLEFRR